MEEFVKALFILAIVAIVAIVHDKKLTGNIKLNKDNSVDTTVNITSNDDNKKEQ